MFDVLWSLLPQAEASAFARIAAYTAHTQRAAVADEYPDVRGGSAQDASRMGLPIRVDSGLAIISLMGPMMRRAGPMASAFGIAGTDATRLAVDSAVADASVDRIVLRIDSPGGSVAGLDQLGESVAKSAKPITAVIDGMAASAAYYVASQAGNVVASRNDLVGSIGTRVMLYDASKAFADMGIKAVPIDTGKYKSAGAEGTEITDEQRADFQRIVDFYFADFVATVARGRGLSDEQVRTLADGRVWPASEAVASRLIDGVQTYREALSEARSSIARSTETARARMRI